MGLRSLFGTLSGTSSLEQVVQLAPLVEDTEGDDEDDDPKATQGDEHQGPCLGG